jgi:hypothetical protein
MGIAIVIILLCMLAFGVHELRMFAIWAFTEHENEDEPEIEREHGTRKINRNGYIYSAPIDKEPENDTFEWTVERFRVEGEELKKDEDFGKNIF